MQAAYANVFQITPLYPIVWLHPLLGVSSVYGTMDEGDSKGLTEEDNSSSRDSEDDSPARKKKKTNGEQ